MGRPIDISEKDFENMNPNAIKITFLIALAAPLLFFALKSIHP